MLQTASTATLRNLRVVLLNVIKQLGIIKRTGYFSSGCADGRAGAACFQVAPPRPRDTHQLDAGAASLTKVIPALCSTIQHAPGSAKTYRNTMIRCSSRCSGKLFKPPLPNMTAATVVLMISANMTREQPLYELTQSGWVVRSTTR